MICLLRYGGGCSVVNQSAHLHSAMHACRNLVQLCSRQCSTKAMLCLESNYKDRISKDVPNALTDRLKLTSSRSLHSINDKGDKKFPIGA
jgi:hypothetical protein